MYQENLTSLDTPQGSARDLAGLSLNKNQEAYGPRCLLCQKTENTNKEINK